MERINPGQADKPATQKQLKMVEQLLRDFPSSRGIFEYEDYQATPTRGNASEFITRAIEDNYEVIAKKENYVDYIANRPRVQKIGAHGLFNDSQGPLVLSQVAEEVAHHPGVVWLPIISLLREDAARLGYDSAESWQSLLTRQVPEIAKAMKIPLDQFRWYAAFHDEGHHPHCHMVCYSADGKSGFLAKQGIAEVKSMLAKEIFQQDLIAIYQRQTQRRDEAMQAVEPGASDDADQSRYQPADPSAPTKVKAPPSGLVFNTTASFLYHMGRIFQEQQPQPAGGVRCAVDSKLKRKIREKKIAMGHKPDDHEDQEQTMT